MPTRQDVRYWGVCWKWGFLPYPCRKHREEWCYEFEWVREHRILFVSRIEGCEKGVKYCGTKVVFFLFGTVTFYNITVCYKKKLSVCGSC